MKPVDVVIAGLNTILPLMTTEILKVFQQPLKHSFFLPCYSKSSFSSLSYFLTIACTV